MKSRIRTIVLLSGGLDSSANLALAIQKGWGKEGALQALTVDYGQRAAPREIAAAQALCRHYEVPHQILDLKWLGELGGSDLTQTQNSVPHLSEADLDDPGVTVKSAERVWVPNRNGVLIQVAGAFADRLKAGQILVGFNAEEAATFPDNSKEFLAAATESLRFSTSNQVRVECFTSDMNKKEIVESLKSLRPAFPFDLVWSCYLGDAKPCRKCESCQRFARAMREVL